MIAAAILICAYAPAKANFYNGNELLSFCTDKNTMEVCYGYIAGLADEENTVSILSCFDRPINGCCYCIFEKKCRHKALAGKFSGSLNLSHAFSLHWELTPFCD
jgi:hypothetical protein